MNIRPMLTYSAIVVAGAFALSAWAWVQLPDDALVPIHWGIDGQADGFAPKTIGLLILPVVAAVVAALLAVVPRIEPRRANLERSSKAYGATWLAVMTVLGAVHVLAIAVTLGADLDVSRIALTGVGAMFVVIGNYLPKVRPNYLMGIRTPWTLSSDLSWVKTHRIGGRLFVLEGIALIVLGLLQPSPVILAVALVLAIVATLAVAVIYSYRVWRGDPERRAL
jgi:uncharacterized membrane protein